MRGKSELKQEGAAASQTSSGLDRDYITNWSYGIGETLTLLVPNVKEMCIRDRYKSGVEGCLCSLS